MSTVDRRRPPQVFDVNLFFFSLVNDVLWLCGLTVNHSDGDSCQSFLLELLCCWFATSSPRKFQHPSIYAALQFRSHYWRWFHMWHVALSTLFQQTSINCAASIHRRLHVSIEERGLLGVYHISLPETPISRLFWAIVSWIGWEWLSLTIVCALFALWVIGYCWNDIPRLLRLGPLF